MKLYRTNLESHHKKCRQLEEEKAILKESKRQLEKEVARLREELEAVSLNSSISSISFQWNNSHSDSGFPAQNVKPISVRILPL